MTARAPLRVGLLGCGRIAAMFHAPILARPGTEIVAIADADTAARDRVGRHAPGAVRFADWRGAIRLGGFDAAVICLPPALHAPAAIAAFEAGLHVYVEKPLALDLAEADAMIAAQRAAGTIGRVGFNFRFQPLYADLRARLRAGELGRVVAVRTLFASARRRLPGWKADPGAGGGALADLGTHHLDLVAHLTGQDIDAGSIHATERRGPEGAIATLACALADGTPVQMLFAQTSGHGAQLIEILGERGHLTVDLADARPRAVQTPPGRWARVRRIVERLRLLSPAELLHAPGREPSFALALQDFAVACRGGASSGVAAGLEDGRRALALVLAVEQAARQRTLPEMVS